jgi:hypothetical protein
MGKLWLAKLLCLAQFCGFASWLFSGLFNRLQDACNNFKKRNRRQGSRQRLRAFICSVLDRVG